MENQSSYFKTIVNDAIKDLRSKKTGFCFSQKQVDVIKSKTTKEIIVKYKEGIYYLSVA